MNNYEAMIIDHLIGTPKEKYEYLLKLEKENTETMSEEQDIEDKDKALHIGRVIISLRLREQIELIHNATKKATEKRKNQGFGMTHKKKQMYEMGFEDAIKWILGNEL